MTVPEMITRVQNRTPQTSSTKILGELQSAASWVQSRLINTSCGLDMLVTMGTETTLNADTRTYDLSALSGFFGIKQILVKFVGGEFQPIFYRDATDPEFRVTDISDDVATEHPIYFDVLNLHEVRFSPALPDGATISIDYFRVGPVFAADTEPEDGVDLPVFLHEALVDKATAQVFNQLDDDRDLYWERQADIKLRDGLNALQRRAQAPIRVGRFRRGRK